MRYRLVKLARGSDTASRARSAYCLLPPLAALALCLGVPLARSVAAAPMVATACRDSDPGVIRADGLFHDGGPLYLRPTEPEANAPVTLTLRTYACDVNAARLSYRLSASAARQSVPLRRIGRDQTGIYDLWQTTIRSGPAGTLLDYRFQVQDGKATQWYGAYGVAPAGFGAGSFAIAPGFHTPAWAQNAVFYQIFPDRFKNGNPHNDVRTGEYQYQGQPVLAQPWTALPENPGQGRDFFGGDLAGIMREMNPYLKQTLGVTALYLNPIFQSLSNHKYDTQDYFRVDPHFGSNADLVALLKHAHSSGEYKGDYRLSIVLDGVFNHSGDSIRWFNKEGLYPPKGAYNTRRSPWFSFYSFTRWPDQYDSFAGNTPSMPRLNYVSAGVRDIIYRKPDSVVQTYLRPPYGIDGWRLDDANEVGSNGGTDDNQAIWQGVRGAVKGVSPNNLLIGEYWNNAQPWLDGTQWSRSTTTSMPTPIASTWRPSRRCRAATGATPCAAAR